jgi:hypothetical protein
MNYVILENVKLLPDEEKIEPETKMRCTEYGITHEHYSRYQLLSFGLYPSSLF